MSRIILGAILIGWLTFIAGGTTAILVYYKNDLGGITEWLKQFVEQ